jgi:hypothetical protein
MLFSHDLGRRKGATPREVCLMPWRVHAPPQTALHNRNPFLIQTRLDNHQKFLHAVNPISRGKTCRLHETAM